MSTLACPPEKLGTERWLLSQLCSSLQHHLAYTCRVKKHTVILYRQGKELDALSHALFQLKSSKSKPLTSAQDSDHIRVCTDINTKIHKHIDQRQQPNPSSFDVDTLTKSFYPVLWDSICILTRSKAEKK